MSNNSQNVKMLDKDFFENYLTLKIMECQRYDHKFSIYVFGIDCYKKYSNFNCSQLTEFILSTIRPIIRKSDVFAKFDDGKFAVVLPNVNIQGALNAGIKAKNAVNTAVFTANGEEIKLTISLGITELKEDDDYTSFVARLQKLFDDSEKNENSIEIY
jgi:diguanylate cyclase (GGDEF)-like protein